MKYNQAIRELNERLNESPRSWELAILGSLMFIAIEVLQGNDTGAQMHLQSARKIIKNADNSIVSPDSACLVNAVSRLDVQSSCSAEQQDFEPMELPTIRSYFTGIDEAREDLNSIINTMNTLFRMRGSGINISLRPPPLSPDMANCTSAILSLLQSWETVFTAYVTQSSIMDTPDIKLAGGIRILLIHCRVAFIKASAFLGGDETAYDGQVRNFQSIVDLAVEVLETDRPDLPSIRSGPCHTFDLGLVQPLFFVACKCRDKVLRRKAAEALETVREERAHNLRLLTQITRWVIETEESASEQSTKVLTEESRLRTIDFDYGGASQSCMITAWRVRRDGSWEQICGIVSAHGSSQDVL
ncbi:hypothetical protein BX600DRAFT_473690 [Xylariales sp. PMI_506]|nr:hypothetical protein BX600DRAFT_473690 [Xylariales sp. PMI_506]